MTNKETVFLYHADCPDGFGAAWAAWKKFGDKAEYIPVHHSHPVPEGITGRKVYLLDFMYSEEITRDLIKNNKSVTGIDHHISAEKTVKLTKDYSYAVHNSGSVLTWKYFYPEEPVPRMLLYIEDRDLWSHKLKNSDKLCTYIDSFDFDFKQWDVLVGDIEDDSRMAECVKKGEMLFRYEIKLKNQIIDSNARLVNFEGHETYAVNAPHIFASYIGATLYTKKPPIAIIWSQSKDGVVVSLRSDGSADVSKLAAKFGGGGHKAASGFGLKSLKDLPWKDIKK